jgi:hypothetical protein
MTERLAKMSQRMKETKRNKKKIFQNIFLVKFFDITMHILFTIVKVINGESFLKEK